MEIRKMDPSDYDDIYQLWLSCSGMGLNDLDDSREGISAFLQRNPETCFVAADGSQIIGVILVGSDGRRGYIYHTAVCPNRRRQGVARGLVEAALKALEQIGINKAALVVFERNKSGNQFWEHMGFTVRDDLIYRNRQITEMIRIET